MKKILLISMLLIPIFKCYAFEFTRDELNCTVHAGYELNENGELKKFVEKSNWNWIKHEIKRILNIENHEIQSIKYLFINQKFSVNRKSGILSGSYFNTKDLKNTVIDMGSKEQAVKIITTPLYGFMEVQYLRIDLYVQSDIKPMFLTDSSSIFSGICE